MKLRGRFLTRFLYFGLMFALSGCGIATSMEEGIEATGQGGQERSPSLSVEEKLADDRYFYREATRKTFHYEEPEDLMMGGIWQNFMCSEGVGRYAIFQFQGRDLEDDYSVIQMMNEEGEVTETELSFSRQGALFGRETATSDVYQILGHKGAVLIEFSYPDPSQVCIVDEKGEVKAEFPIPGIIAAAYKDGFLVSPHALMADEDYHLYVVWRSMTEAETKMLVLDREGGKLWEETLKDPPSGEYFIQGMTALPNGGVGCVLYYQVEDKIYCRLFAMDPKEGVKELAVLTGTEVDADKNEISYLVCFDEDTLLYATEKGLYRCSYQGKNPEELYLWMENGVRIGANNFIENMRVQPDGDIDILLRANGENVYLRLELATEKKEVLTVPFAVAEEHKSLFQGAVADFNKEHGNCKIEMVVYEEQAKLLTELAAGKGPVLVDTSLVSFKDNESLWECLDEPLEKWEVKDKLLENTLQGGQIDGRQYGLSFSWSITTFASVSYQEESWNYEQFLDHIRNAADLEMLFEYQAPEGALREFLCRSLEESYLIDPEAGKAYFDTERFSDAVALMKRLAGEREPVDSSESAELVRSGKALGEFVALTSASEIAYYDTKFGERLNYVGLPGKAGSCHYIASGDPLAVRATASGEEKEAVLAFLKQLLGKDAQSELVRDYGFSIRRDVLMNQLENMSEELVYIIDGAQVRIPVDKERAKERLLSLYEKAVPEPSLPAEIYQVFTEELSQCFRGSKTVEEAAEVLQNRVQLYLDERK